MRPPIVGLRPCTWVWLGLVALTCVTYAIGQTGMSSIGAALWVLGLAVLKGHWVAEHFMGLSRVRWRWRVLLLGYLVVVGGGIALAYLTAVS